MNESEIIAGFIKGVSDSVADKIGEAPAKTFNSIWDIVFGGVDSFSEKIAFKRTLDVQSFKKSLEDKILDIPENHIQEPEISLLGPALESTKYYISNEILRELFINLIAKSMDDRYNDDVNHAFVEIIKQLSPIDAYVLKKINTKTLPAAKYKLIVTDGSLPLSDYYIIDDIFNEKQLSISITNIKRLGLLETPEGLSMTDKDLYTEFLTNDVYDYYSKNNQMKVLIQRVNTHMRLYNLSPGKALDSMNVHLDDRREFFDYKGVDIDKSYVRLNNFGLSFYNICIN